MHRHIRFLLLLVLSVLFLPVVAYAQNASLPPTIFITKVDTSQFPQVTLFVGARNLPVAMEQAVVKVYEDDQLISDVTTTSQALGTQVAFLIDASGSMRDPGLTGKVRLEEVRTSLQNLVAMRALDPTTDWVAAFAPVGRDIGIVQDWTRDHQALVNQVMLYEVPTGQRETPLFNLLFFALDHFSAPDMPDYLTKSIVLFSDGISGGSSLDLNDAVNRAIAMNIPIHTVLLGNSAEGKRNMERIALLTGGMFVQINDDNATDPVWRALSKDRTQTILAYRSTNPDPKEIRLEVTLPNGTTVRTVHPFPALELQPVRVTLVSPGPGLFIQKVAETHDQPLAEVEPKELEIQVAFEWPDGKPRRLQRVEYIIDGHTEVRTEEPFDRIVFPITDLDTGGHTLRVVAVDELGLEGTSEPLPFEVDVYRPPAPPPTVTRTIFGRTIEVRRDLLTLIANAAALLLGVLAVIIALRNPERRARVTRIVTQIGQTVTQPFQRHRTQTRAYLVVKDRGEGSLPRESEIPIGKDVILIGRDPHASDVLCDDPRVSRRHAVLRLNPSGQYCLLDDGGRSGVFVNGQPVTTGQEVPLSSGDLIAIGPVEFRFYYANEMPVADMGSDTETHAYAPLKPTPSDAYYHDDETQLGR